MNKKIFTPETDGFYGAWYPCQNSTKSAFILVHKMAEGRMAEGPAKWFLQQGISVMLLAPMPEDNHEFNEYPIDWVQRSIDWMKEQGIERFSIGGQSQTAMLSLLAASKIPDITLTLAFTPNDFLMEATKTIKNVERPLGKSYATWRGEALPYLVFTDRGDALTARMKKEGKETGNMLYGRGIFKDSEEAHTLTEAEYIKVEDIKGKVICFGAKDDAMWDTEMYINRMEKRLEKKTHDCQFEKHIYEHGTHYVLPQGVIKGMLPASSFLIGIMFKAGKTHKKECLKTRLDIERIVVDALAEWKE